MFRKRNSISKRNYKRTGRASSKRPSPDKKYLYLTKNITFLSKTSRPGNRLEYPPVIRTRPEPVRSPGIRASVASRMSLPSACCTVRPTPFLTMPCSGSRLVITPGSVPSFRHGRRSRSPLSRSRGEIASRTPKTGTCHPHQSKSFTGKGGPGEGDAFSKAPSSPGKSPASSVKTYAPASASASPAAFSEAGPARGASATERSGICHCPGRGAVSSAFSPT